MPQKDFKIVLSRKGFDSASGGCASPIFPNGRFVSLPINYEPGSPSQYCQIRTGVGLPGSEMGEVVEQLSGGVIGRERFAHLDPDLDANAIPRLSGWRGAFGQCETAQVHLANQGVGIGDVFLFHGWFREVEMDRAGRWRFRPGSPNLNVIFGWLQVGEVINLERTSASEAIKRFPWLNDHPHLHFPTGVVLKPTAHAIYLAAEQLELPGVPTGRLPGWGVFRSFTPRLVLTAPRATGRSTWKLPMWFKGDGQRPWLTQYPRPDWWTDVEDGVLLQPTGRQGQEAVLDSRGRPEAGAWLAAVIGDWMGGES